jgi:two-component system sensor histidine kinase KdpD
MRALHPAVEFLIATATTLLVAALCYPFVGSIGYQSVGLVFLMAIAILSLFLGRSALIFAAVLNFGVWNFFFIQPLYTFRVHSLHDLIALFTNLIVAIAASTLISRIRKSQVDTEKSREQLEIIHRFLGSLNDSISIKDVVKRTGEIMQEMFGAPVVIYLKEKKGPGLAARPFGNTTLHSEPVYLCASTLFLRLGSETETLSKAGEPVTSGEAFSFSHMLRKAGSTLNARILPDPADLIRKPEPVLVRTVPGDHISDSGGESGIRLYPLESARKLIGVIGIEWPGKMMPEDEKQILFESFLTLAASAIDREMSIDQLKEQEIGEESEKLFQTVLNSVSHELKTPIAIISAAVANLMDEKTSSEPEIRKQIGEELEIASGRLNHLVENILDMSRIESGLLRLNLELCDIADLLGIVHQDLRITDHTLDLRVDDGLSFIRADISLLRQALINILHNAIAYTPKNTTIFVGVSAQSPDSITITVRDEGPGIAEQYLPQLFGKFYRVPGTASGGTGLGLTISRAIIELHGGTIVIRNHPLGGLEVTVGLRTQATEVFSEPGEVLS